MSLDEIRRRYAEEVCRVAETQNEVLLDAFARVPRERFLGPGPWLIAQPLNPAAPYQQTPDASPERVYQDAAISIDAARQLNNGQPSGHARWIDSVSPKAGESVLHIGCGTGYFTAILAELVGRSGSIEAHEVDPELASRARTCLAEWSQVRVQASDAGRPKGKYDVIYLNAGATHARPEWLAALKPGGRLFLPLTAHIPMFPHGIGFAVRVDRAEGLWPARLVSPIGIFDCAGARDAAAEAQLRKLLSPQMKPNVRAVSTERHEPGERCLVHIDGFCLQS